MKKGLRFLPVVMAVLGIMICINGCDKENKKVVILYTNDVHCSIDHYDTLAAYKAELLEQGEKVFLIDGGDFAQGAFHGKIDDGASIIQLMNAVGYDFAVPGNHDYGYGMEAFLRNAAQSEFTYLSANFDDQKDGGEAFLHEAYHILDCNGQKIALIGIESDEACDTDFLQPVIDDAKKAGAEAVIAVGHTGDEMTQPLIENTTGIDIFLNAHDHVLSDMFENQLSCKNAEGKDIPVFETGSGMKYICRMDLLVSQGEVQYSVNMMTPEDIELDLNQHMSEKAKTIKENVEREITAINEKVEGMNQPIAKSECVLAVYDPVKFPDCVDFREYNSSDLLVDAFRIVGKADIGIVNTTALRIGLEKGDVGKIDLCNLNPWFENVYVAELSGQQLLDLLERGTKKWPEYTSCEPAVSGMTFSVDCTIAPEEGKRVYDVKIGGEAIDPEKTYSVASSVYYLFKANADIVGKTQEECRSIGMDCDVLETYVCETLGGVISEKQYGALEGSGRVYLKTE